METESPSEKKCREKREKCGRDRWKIKTEGKENVHEASGLQGKGDVVDRVME